MNSFQAKGHMLVNDLCEELHKIVDCAKSPAEKAAVHYILTNMVKSLATTATTVVRNATEKD